MIIQLQAPKNGVTDWVVNYLSKKLVALHRRHPQISNAQVYLREPGKREKSCTIGLKMKGASMTLSRSANSFSKACYFVLLDIESKLKELFKKDDIYTLMSKRLVAEGKL